MYQHLWQLPLAEQFKNSFKNEANESSFEFLYISQKYDDNDI